MGINLYKAIYDVISPVVHPYITAYPYRSDPIDFVTGHCSFSDTLRKNLTGGSSVLSDDGTLLLSSTVEISMSIVLERFLNQGESDLTLPPPDQSTALQAYLKSDEAVSLFNDKGYSLAPIWSDIICSGKYDESKRWVASSSFDIVFYADIEYIITAEPLREVKIVGDVFPGFFTT